MSKLIVSQQELSRASDAAANMRTVIAHGVAGAEDLAPVLPAGLSAEAEAEIRRMTYALARSFLAPEPWIPVTFNDTWQNFGGAYQTAQYRKDPFGIVHVRGVVKRPSGSATVIFNLPEGYRPPATLLFETMANGAIARVDVGTNGDFSAVSGSGFDNFFTLSNISFDTRS